MSDSFDKENLNGQEPEKAPEAAQNESPASRVEESTIFVKHVYNTKKPAKNGTKKRVIICVIAAVLCAAIIVGIIGIDKLIPDAATSDFGLTSSVAEEESFLILKMADIIKDSKIQIDGQEVEVDTNIKSVEFINGLEQFTCMPYFVKAEKKENSSSDVSSSTSSGSASSVEKKTYLYETKWYVDGIDKNKTVSSAIYSKIKDCLTIRGFREMENTFSSVEEYHNYYGMSKKLNAGCVFKFTDGTPDLTIYVGSLLATGEAYYFMTSLSEKVYVVESSYAEYYACSTKEFADPTVIESIVKDANNKPYFNDSEQLARFDTIKISGDVFGGKTYEFEMAKGASADYMPYLMTVPYRRPANDEFISKVLGFADDGLDATVLYSYSVTDKDIKACGFDKPKCIIELKVDDFKFKLTIGGYLDDYTDSMAAMIEGKDQVYGIDIDDVAFLVNASNNITKMFNEDFILEDIYTVKSFDMKVPTGSYRFDLTHTLREGETKVYDTVVKKGSTVMDTKSFKLIYQRVLMLSLMEYVTEAEYSEPVLTVQFNFIEGGAPKVVEFTESPDDMYHYVAWVDGTPLGEVLKSSVTDITDCLDKYLSGEEVPDTW